MVTLPEANWKEIASPWRPVPMKSPTTWESARTVRRRALRRQPDKLNRSRMGGESRGDRNTPENLLMIVITPHHKFTWT